MSRGTHVSNALIRFFFFSAANPFFKATLRHRHKLFFFFSFFFFQPSASFFLRRCLAPLSLPLFASASSSVARNGKRLNYRSNYVTTEAGNLVFLMNFVARAPLRPYAIFRRSIKKLRLLSATIRSFVRLQPSLECEDTEWLFLRFSLLVVSCFRFSVEYLYDIYTILIF